MAGLTKKTIRKGGTAIKRARALMNDGGKHWIKGALEGRVYIGSTGVEDYETGYCSIGGVRQAMFGDTDEPVVYPDEYIAAITLLAQAIDPKKKTYAYRSQATDPKKKTYAYWSRGYNEVNGYRDVKHIAINPMTDPLPVDAIERASLVETIEAVIVGYNDKATVGWKRIASRFDKAYKAARS